MQPLANTGVSTPTRPYNFVQKVKLDSEGLKACSFIIETPT